MPFKLGVVVVVVVLDGGVLDRSAHPLDLPVRPCWLSLVKRCSMPFSSQRIEAVGRRQERMTPEGDDDGFLRSVSFDASRTEGPWGVATLSDLHPPPFF